MIGFFPPLYKDELIYSLLARYYVKSGYMVYKQVADDLFKNPATIPVINFVNNYTDDALKYLTTINSMEYLIENHTMFPYYGRFLPYERKKKAMKSLVEMKSNYNNELIIPNRKSSKGSFLRYCPICAAKDREKYGETYWHRIHQMFGVNICPIHHCYLIDSPVKIGSKVSPTLITAEEVIPISENILYSNNTIQCQLAKYVMDVFLLKVDFEINIFVGDFLYSCMSGTKYRSIRGEQCNITLLHNDFITFYKELPNNWFHESWQIQKLLANDRINIVEICMLGMFLGINSEKFHVMTLPKKSQQELFDEKIYYLREKGLKYPQIAAILNAPIDTIKSICKKKKEKYHKLQNKPQKMGAKPKDWKKIDDEYFPLVKNAIKQLYGDGINRPKKVTIFAVEKKLDMPNKQISLHLPRCKAEILANQESQESYWAREFVWAVNILIREGKPLNWKHIRDLTNMRRSYYEACVPYLDRYADPKILELIKNSTLNTK